MNTLTTITETNPCFLCVFCKSGLVDDINLGQLFMYDGVVTHYFCMLFSAALSQNGRDDEGILGFLPNDIMAEVRRSFRLRCTYCGSVGASVGCCNKKCRTAFHYPCGLKHGANYQFFGNYESYCSEHVQLREIMLPKREWFCPICTSKVLTRLEVIQSSCCRSAVFHKECLQKLALSSGYFFKCPLCNNGQEFVHEMRSLGIFVPEQDASWEREPNAYEDLYYQHSQCDVPNCLCPKGPSYSAQKGSWILARCRICGAAGTHKQCSNLATVDNWACEPCLIVELRTEKEKKVMKQNAVAAKSAIEVPASSASSSRNDSADAADEEAYVSARSGNRKVRNGRLQRRTGGKKSSWKLSNLRISPWCFWYFPYDQQTLTYFDSQSSLPDWRRLQLRVNLVNWIPKSVFEGADTRDDAPIQKVTIEGIADEDRALISDSEIVTSPIIIPKTKTKKFKRRPARRASGWASGIIKKRKQAHKYLHWKNQLSAVGKIPPDYIHQDTDSSCPSYEVIPAALETDDEASQPPLTSDFSNPVTPSSPPHGPSDLYEDSCHSPEIFPDCDIDISEDEELPLLNSDDFQIDIQSTVEIEDPDGEKENAVEIPLADPNPGEVLDAVGTQVTAGCPTDDDASPFQDGRVDADAGKEKCTAGDAHDGSDGALLPLSELNTLLSPETSPTKFPLIIPATTNLDNHERSENLEACQFTTIQEKYVRMDHSYSMPTCEKNKVFPSVSPYANPAASLLPE